MTSERFEQRRQDLGRATRRLSEIASLPFDDVVRDAAIQRFEFTFELVWKTLKLWLDHHGLDAATPRDVLKKAFASGLIQTPEEAEIWLRMLADRNFAAHVYSERLADETYRRIVADYVPRLCEMGVRIRGLSWK